MKILIVTLALSLVGWLMLGRLRDHASRPSRRAVVVDWWARIGRHPLGAMGMRGRFARAVCSAHIVMPSKTVLSAEMIGMRLAESTALSLSPNGNLDLLADDARRLYRRHAQQSGWSLSTEPVVFIQIDETLHHGWIPPASVLAEAPDEFEGISLSETVASDGPEVKCPVGDHVGDHDRVTEEYARLSTNSRDEMLTDIPPTRLDVESNTNLVLIEHRTADRVVIETDSTVGRGLDAQVVIADPSISRIHARFAPDGPAWAVTDLGSSAGTFLNGKRLPIHGSRLLRDGDDVSLGRSRYRVATRLQD